MTEDNSNKPESGTPGKSPKGSGDNVRNAQKWGGGTKGSKGPITEEDRHNPNSSAKS